MKDFKKILLLNNLKHSFRERKSEGKGKRVTEKNNNVSMYNNSTQRNIDT